MKKKELVHKVESHFKKHFNKESEYVFMSPGRINIIGEHVDYNDGFVLPAAINKYICFAVSKNNDMQCRLVAIDLNDAYEFKVTDELKPIEKGWVNYFLGVLHQLKERYSLTGFNIAFSSTIPMGAGLSSSAALECGFGYALDTIFTLGISKQQLSLIGQKSEHTFVGVNCGIMDQFASVFGKEDQVIKLDCMTYDYEYHKANFKEYTLLLLDSKVKHTHLTSGYNVRRQEVEKGLEVIKKHYPAVRGFRDVSMAMVEEVRQELGDVVYRRCHFVVREIQRVLDAVEALEKDDFKKLGNLMLETHDGLSKEYEVSCEEIDFLVDAVRDNKDVLGARMMGGGFGGCSINLVKKGAVNDLIKIVEQEYENRYGITLEAYKIKISEGTSQYKKYDTI